MVMRIAPTNAAPKITQVTIKGRMYQAHRDFLYAKSKGATDVEAYRKSYASFGNLTPILAGEIAKRTGATVQRIKLSSNPNTTITNISFGTGELVYSKAFTKKNTMNKVMAYTLGIVGGYAIGRLAIHLGTQAVSSLFALSGKAALGNALGSYALTTFGPSLYSNAIYSMTKVDVRTTVKLASYGGMLHQTLRNWQSLSRKTKELIAGRAPWHQRAMSGDASVRADTRKAAEEALRRIRGY